MSVPQVMASKEDIISYLKSLVEEGLPSAPEGVGTIYRDMEETDDAHSSADSNQFPMTTAIFRELDLEGTSLPCFGASVREATIGKRRRVSEFTHWPIQRLVRNFNWPRSNIRWPAHVCLRNCAHLYDLSAEKGAHSPILRQISPV